MCMILLYFIFSKISMGSLMSINSTFNQSPNEMITIGKWEYSFYNYHVTWEEARIICQGYGSQLATLDVEDVATSLTRMTSESSLENEEHWIGSRMGSLGYWFWLGNKKKLELNQFLQEMVVIPRYANKTVENDSFCLTIFRKNHYEPMFTPLRCRKKRPFVCQKEKIQNENSIINLFSTKIGDEDFILFSGKLTWLEAVIQCRQRGLQIAEIKTLDQAQILATGMLRTRPKAIENVWIGGFVKEHSWKWLSSGYNILRNELWPNETGLMEFGDCLLLDRHLCTLPTYVSTKCDRRRNFLCQSQEENTSAAKFIDVTVDQCEYYMGLQPQNWSIAFETCKNMNSTLVTLDSPKTMKHIIHLMIDNREEFQHVWINGKRQLINNETHKRQVDRPMWQWESGGQRIPGPGESFIPWCDDCQYDKNDADCLNLDRENFNVPIVYGLDCSNKQKFICQKWTQKCDEMKVLDSVMTTMKFINNSDLKTRGEKNPEIKSDLMQVNMTQNVRAVSDKPTTTPDVSSYATSNFTTTVTSDRGNNNFSAASTDEITSKMATASTGDNNFTTSLQQTISETKSESSTKVITFTPSSTKELFSETEFNTNSESIAATLSPPNEPKTLNDASSKDTADTTSYIITAAQHPATSTASIEASLKDFTTVYTTESLHTDWKNIINTETNEISFTPSSQNQISSIPTFKTSSEDITIKKTVSLQKDSEVVFKNFMKDNVMALSTSSTAFENKKEIVASSTISLKLDSEISIDPEIPETTKTESLGEVTDYKTSIGKNKDHTSIILGTGNKKTETTESNSEDISVDLTTSFFTDSENENETSTEYNAAHSSADLDSFQYTVEAYTENNNISITSSFRADSEIEVETSPENIIATSTQEHLTSASELSLEDVRDDSTAALHINTESPIETSTEDNAIDFSVNQATSLFTVEANLENNTVSTTSLLERDLEIATETNKENFSSTPYNQENVTSTSAFEISSEDITADFTTLLYTNTENSVETTENNAVHSSTDQATSQFTVEASLEKNTIFTTSSLRKDFETTMEISTEDIAVTTFIQENITSTPTFETSSEDSLVNFTALSHTKFENAIEISTEDNAYHSSLDQITSETTAEAGLENNTVGAISSSSIDSETSESSTEDIVAIPFVQDKVTTTAAFEISSEGIALNPIDLLKTDSVADTITENVDFTIYSLHEITSKNDIVKNSQDSTVVTTPLERKISSTTVEPSTEDADFTLYSLDKTTAKTKLRESSENDNNLQDSTVYAVASFQTDSETTILIEKISSRPPTDDKISSAATLYISSGEVTNNIITSPERDFEVEIKTSTKDYASTTFDFIETSFANKISTDDIIFNHYSTDQMTSESAVQTSSEPIIENVTTFRQNDFYKITKTNPEDIGATLYVDQSTFETTSEYTSINTDISFETESNTQIKINIEDNDDEKSAMHNVNKTKTSTEDYIDEISLIEDEEIHKHTPDPSKEVNSEAIFKSTETNSVDYSETPTMQFSVTSTPIVKVNRENFKGYSTDLNEQNFDLGTETSIEVVTDITSIQSLVSSSDGQSSAKVSQGTEYPVTFITINNTSIEDIKDTPIDFYKQISESLLEKSTEKVTAIPTLSNLTTMLEVETSVDDFSDTQQTLYPATSITKDGISSENYEGISTDLIKHVIEISTEYAIPILKNEITTSEVENSSENVLNTASAQNQEASKAVDSGGSEMIAINRIAVLQTDTTNKMDSKIEDKAPQNKSTSGIYVQQSSADIENMTKFLPHITTLISAESSQEATFNTSETQNLATSTPLYYSSLENSESISTESFKIPEPAIKTSTEDLTSTLENEITTPEVETSPENILNTLTALNQEVPKATDKISAKSITSNKMEEFQTTNKIKSRKEDIDLHHRPQEKTVPETSVNYISSNIANITTPLQLMISTTPVEISTEDTDLVLYSIDETTPKTADEKSSENETFMTIPLEEKASTTIETSTENVDSTIYSLHEITSKNNILENSQDSAVVTTPLQQKISSATVETSMEDEDFTLYSLEETTAKTKLRKSSKNEAVTSPLQEKSFATTTFETSTENSDFTPNALDELTLKTNSTNISEDVTIITIPLQQKISSATVETSTEDEDFTLYSLEETTAKTKLRKSSKNEAVTSPLQEKSFATTTFETSTENSDFTPNALDELTLKTNSTNISEDVTVITIPLQQKISSATVETSTEDEDFTLYSLEETTAKTKLRKSSKNEAVTSPLQEKSFATTTFETSTENSDFTPNALDELTLKTNSTNISEDVTVITIPLQQKISSATVETSTEDEDFTLYSLEETTAKTKSRKSSKNESVTSSLQKKAFTTTVETSTENSDFTPNALDELTLKTNSTNISEDVTVITIPLQQKISSATVETSTEDEDFTLYSLEETTAKTKSRKSSKNESVTSSLQKKAFTTTVETSTENVEFTRDALEDITPKTNDAKISEETLITIPLQEKASFTTVNPSTEDADFTLDKIISKTTIDKNDAIITNPLQPKIALKTSTIDMDLTQHFTEKTTTKNAVKESTKNEVVINSLQKAGLSTTVVTGEEYVGFTRYSLDEITPKTNVIKSSEEAFITKKPSQQKIFTTLGTTSTKDMNFIPHSLDKITPETKIVKNLEDVVVTTNPTEKVTFPKLFGISYNKKGQKSIVFVRPPKIDVKTRTKDTVSALNKNASDLVQSTPAAVRRHEYTSIAAHTKAIDLADTNNKFKVSITPDVLQNKTAAENRTENPNSVLKSIEPITLAVTLENRYRDMVESFGKDLRKQNDKEFKVDHKESSQDIMGFKDLIELVLKNLNTNKTKALQNLNISDSNTNVIQLMNVRNNITKIVRSNLNKKSIDIATSSTLMNHLNKTSTIIPYEYKDNLLPRKSKTPFRFNIKKGNNNLSDEALSENMSPQFHLQNNINNHNTMYNFGNVMENIFMKNITNLNYNINNYNNAESPKSDQTYRKKNNDSTRSIKIENFSLGDDESRVDTSNNILAKNKKPSLNLYSYSEINQTDSHDLTTREDNLMDSLHKDVSADETEKKSYTFYEKTTPNIIHNVNHKKIPEGKIVNVMQEVRKNFQEMYPGKRISFRVSDKLGYRYQKNNLANDALLNRIFKSLNNTIRTVNNKTVQFNVKEFSDNSTS